MKKKKGKEHVSTRTS